MARITQRLGLTRFDAEESYKQALDAFRKGRFEEALIKIGEAISFLPDEPEYWATRGLIYLEDDIPEQAQESFDEALRLNPYELLAHYGQGVLAYRERQWNKAQEHFTAAFRSDQNRPETFYYLALVHHHKGENNIALKVMQKAQSLFEERQDKRRTDAGKWIKRLENLTTP